MYRTKVAQLLHPQLPPLLPNVQSGLSKISKIFITRISDVREGNHLCTKHQIL